MKLRIILPVFFLMCTGIVSAQDLIVKDNGDSLNCKIIYIKNDYIHFSFKYEDKVQVSLLPLDQVKSHKKNFYQTSEVAPEKVIVGSYRKVRLAFSGGWSYETAKVSSSVHSALQDYLKELKSGYHFGGDATYFISPYIGFGLKYSAFRTKNSIDRISLVNTVTGQVISGRLEDDITVQFIAPAFMTRVSSGDQKTHFIADVAVGYLSYKDRAIVIDNYTLTGSTLGIQLGIGVDFALVSNISLGIGVSYLMGALTQYEIDDGAQKQTVKLDDGSTEGLNRFDISIGLRWSE